MTGKDSDFSEERLVTRYNSELANSLGNLLNRGLTMIWKFRDGSVTRASGAAGEIGDVDSDATAAMASALRLADICNERIDAEKPWVLAKDPAQGEKLDALLYHLAESLRLIAILISPVVPKAAHGVFDQLQWKLELSGEEKRFSLGETGWGGLPDGHIVGKPSPLFPRIEKQSAPAP